MPPGVTCHGLYLNTSGGLWEAEAPHLCETSDGIKRRDGRLNGHRWPLVSVACESKWEYGTKGSHHWGAAARGAIHPVRRSAIAFPAQGWPLELRRLFKIGIPSGGDSGQGWPQSSRTDAGRSRGPSRRMVTGEATPEERPPRLFF